MTAANRNLLQILGLAERTAQLANDARQIAEQAAFTVDPAYIPPVRILNSQRLRYFKDSMGVAYLVQKVEITTVGWISNNKESYMLPEARRIVVKGYFGIGIKPRYAVLMDYAGDAIVHPHCATGGISVCLGATKPAEGVHNIHSWEDFLKWVGPAAEVLTMINRPGMYRIGAPGWDEYCSTPPAEDLKKGFTGSTGDGYSTAGIYCAQCGKSFKKVSDLIRCNKCRAYVCTHCVRACHVCGHAYCPRCVIACRTCGKHACHTCWRLCPDCGSRFCYVCWGKGGSGRCAMCHKRYTGNDPPKRGTPERPPIVDDEGVDTYEELMVSVAAVEKNLPEPKLEKEDLGRCTICRAKMVRCGRCSNIICARKTRGHMCPRCNREVKLGF